MKKIIALLLVVALTAALSVSLTLAYLNDTDEDVNVMTLGSVKIVQHEQQRVNDTDKQDELELYQDKAIYPAVYEGSSIPWAPEVEWVEPYNQAWKVVEDNECVIDKFVTVENTGESPAYVRTILAIEVGANASNARYMHIVNNADNVTKANPDAATWDWKWVKDDEGNTAVVTIGQSTYMLWVATYTAPLASKATTIPSLKQVYLDKDATNEIVANYGSTYEILAFSQAVQTAGFETPAQALDTAFGAITATSHPWDGKEGSNGTVPQMVATAEELTNALNDGGYVVATGDIETPAATKTPYNNHSGFVQRGGTFDGGNNTLTITDNGDNGEQGSWGIETHGGTIKNVVIDNGFRGIVLYSPTEDVILDNVHSGGEGVCYALNTAEHPETEGIDLIVTNSTLAGWTSFAGIESASFTNVKFEQGAYYTNVYGRVVKPYVNTVFTDCSFVEHMNLDLTELEEGQKITFVNCTVNGQQVSANVFSTPANNGDYETKLFTVDLPDWAETVTDCVIFR